MDRLSREKSILYSGISEQKRKYLQYCINEMQKSEESGNANKISAAKAALKNAVSLVSPAKTYALDTKLPEEFVLYSGGRKSLELDKAADTPACDGILVTVDYDGRGDDAWIQFGVGTDDMFSYTDKLPLPQTGEKMWLSFDMFTPAPVGAERMVAAFECEDEDIEIHVKPEYLFREVAEEDTRVVYSEIPATELSNTKFYKIIELSGKRALAVTPKIREVDLRWNESLIHTDKDQRVTLQANAHDYTQEWQIYKTEYGKYHLVNKSNANHIQLDENGKFVPKDVDMNCDGQDFDISPAGPGKFTFTCCGKPLACENIKSGTWLVMECTYAEWVQTFEDHFEGDKLDNKNWDVYNCKIRPDGEPVYFLDRPENYYVENDNLVIRTSNDGYDGIPQTGAYMDSRGLYGVTYCKMEMSARISTGNWIWPAFWSMGIVGNWPYQGEIDVMEAVGGGENGIENSKLYGTLHWAIEQKSHHMEKGVAFYAKNYENLYDRYHTYAAEWEYDQIRLYIDDMLYMAMNLNADGMKWGFGDNPHYLILNTSVRGPGDNKAYSETAEESLYYIDWVRCYKRAGEVTPCDDLANASVKPAYTNGVAGEWLNKVSVSSDGKYVATAGQNGLVFVYDQKADKLLYTLNNDCVAIEAIAFSPDGKKLFVPDRDSKILIYDCNNFEAEPVCIMNTGAFGEFVTYAPNSDYLFSGGRDTVERGREDRKDSRYLRCWNTDGKFVGEFFAGSDVRNAAVSADEKLAACVCSDGSMKLISIPDFKLVKEYKNDTEAAMRGVDFSGDGKLLTFSDEAGEIYICTLKTLEIKTLQKVNPSSVKRVRFSKDGTKVLALCADNCARLFDVKTGLLDALLGGFTELVSEAKFSDDGELIAVSSYDGRIKIFNKNGAYISTYVTENPKGRWVMDIAFSADSKRIFAAMGIKNTDYCAWNI